MNGRIRQFIAFFVNTFFLVTFVVGSTEYIFASDRITPVPESSTMLLIGIGVAVFGLIGLLRGKEENL